jgi:peptidoglycan-associated lipoprotein
MKDGYGGKDIWRVHLLDGGKWGSLENLGPDINTPGDEMFPYVKANGELYFASDGQPGFGGLDIFKAIPMEDDNWEVENMKEPINSSGDDFGITFAGNDDSGFFSSNRKETKGYDKLWSFGMKKIQYILSGKITDSKNEPLSDAVIRLVGDDGTNTKIRMDKDGTYEYELKEGVQYLMLASDRGFLNSKRDVSTVGLKDGKDFQVNFQLASVSKPVQVNNIFYEFGKWTLTPDSEAGIKELAKLLTDNPNITMEIGAHTDMVGSVEANNELSKKRAQEIVNYLIREGIDAERLTAVGYGENAPVVVTKELANQYPFLKENDVLNEEYVLSKAPEEQEIINQINRRTEFKVLKTTYNMY